MASDHERLPTARRLLFHEASVPDHTAADPSFQSLFTALEQSVHMARQRWAFDFKLGKPQSSTEQTDQDLHWEEVPANTLPEFYSRPVHKKHRQARPNAGTPPDGTADTSTNPAVVTRTGAGTAKRKLTFGADNSSSSTPTTIQCATEPGPSTKQHCDRSITLTARTQSEESTPRKDTDADSATQHVQTNSTN